MQTLRTFNRYPRSHWVQTAFIIFKPKRTMADVALAIVGLVIKIGEIAAKLGYQDFKLLLNLKDEILALKDTYTLIQDVLSDAEVRRSKEKSVETWLKSLRSASFKVENILDGVIADDMMQRLHNELERGINDKVRAFFSSHRNPLSVQVRVALKVRTIRKKLDKIAKDRLQFNFSSNIIGVGVGVGGETTNMETSSLMPTSTIYGRDEEVKTVVEKICSEDIIGHDSQEVQVYAIWGMGGLGKTTLAQLVYNHERVKKHFELQSWVYVSSDFQVNKLTKGITESINKSPCGLSGLDAMHAELQNKLHGKRFLIVLDDVWIEERTQWDELSKALNSGAKGSIVMVTTRNETTSIMMAKVPNFRHQLGCLSENDSWSLFKTLAFALGSKSEGENISNLESIGKEIVKKCKGLPLAVKTLGGLMWSKSSVSAWQSVKDNDVWEELQVNGILPALKLSYDNLLPHMKCCFAYSCLFPKGYEMRKDLLIELWMANGFIPPRRQTDLYVISDEVFHCLVSRSFLQDVQEDLCNDLICKMHDLMNDLGRYLMRRDHFFTDDLITPNGVEVLHFNSSCPGISFSVQELKRLRSLRSLFIFVDEYEGNMISQLSKLVYLRALHLDEIQVSTLPESICKLKHLRYLSICDSKIESLPKSIIYLQNLQVLLLRGCSNLSKLPEGMRYMKNLRCLDNQGCNKLDCMPVGIKELGCLRRLGLFVLGEKKGNQIAELEDLNLLRGRLELKGLENVAGLEGAKSANLKHKTNLMSLVLRWGYRGSEEKIDDGDVVEGLEPNSSLKELRIEGCYLGKMNCMNWMMKLRNLVKIEFWFCRRCESIPPLGKLPSLKVIFLAFMDLRCLGDDEFPSLQELTIRHCCQLVSLPSNLPTLEELTLFEVPGVVSLPNNLPKLTRLRIYDCPEVHSLPNGLKELTSLTIIGCEKLKRRCEKENGEDWPKISHVSNLLLQDNW
ncbi:hypothetical protein OSB04_025467 [Centaurea solstitialis]|uniref:Uncharacterized protein n=1 Tax=Centaurea solstitialis TaxID=347529 RepID=A0AA38SN46_9ASTR|nr:hypothetical protein OSB04_025467 [Centaurea solstitialis]